jgi:PPM family protein phosphatase
VTRPRQDPAFVAHTQGQRERQEDSFRLLRIDPATDKNGGLLLVVADGMGGRAAGNVASDLASETFISHVRDAGFKSIGQDLNEALFEANDAILHQVKRDASLQGMGTTLLAVMISSGVAHWISVGDSVLYLLRQGKLSRLNADHSLAGLHNDMVARGEISADEAERRGGQNKLRSVLMGGQISLIDQSDEEKAIKLQEGDILILGSDGILSLDETKICQVTIENKNTAKSIAESLIESVNIAKIEYQDNTTVVAYLHQQKAQSDQNDNTLLFTLFASFAIISIFAAILFIDLKSIKTIILAILL